MYQTKKLLGLATALALGACTTLPEGPSIAVMPSQGKDIGTFQQEDMACRQYAAQQTGISPGAAAQQSVVNSAVLGTVAGAAAGTLIGAAAGNPGAGAAIGAGSGLVLGSAAGANAGAFSGDNVQRQYDIGYAQCMTAKGNNVTAAPAQTAAYPYPYPAYGYAYPPGYYAPYPVGVYFGRPYWHRHWR
jgi:hypothetical protein